MAMNMAGSSGGGGRRGRRRAVMAEINVTPMVDVMLVLLIIFHGLGAAIDGGRAARSAAGPRPKSLDQDKKSADAFGQPERPGLPQRHRNRARRPRNKLKAITEARGGWTSVFLFGGDKKVDYGTVMKVMGRAVGRRLSARRAGDGSGSGIFEVKSTRPS